LQEADHVLFRPFLYELAVCNAVNDYRSHPQLIPPWYSNYASVFPSATRNEPYGVAIAFEVVDRFRLL
jgi:hypothetical protein